MLIFNLCLTIHETCHTRCVAYFRVFVIHLISQPTKYIASRENPILRILSRTATRFGSQSVISRLFVHDLYDSLKMALWEPKHIYVWYNVSHYGYPLDKVYFVNWFIKYFTCVWHWAKYLTFDDVKHLPHVWLCNISHLFDDVWNMFDTVPYVVTCQTMYEICLCVYTVWNFV
jgi:hypothetical protein